jgi:hypothetical protein
MSKARQLADLGNAYSDGGISGSTLLINGNMEIAQRGSSQTTAGYGSIDRFFMSLSGATATMSQESFTIGQTDVAGSDKYLKLDVTTGNNNSGIYYKVEAKDAFPIIGKKVTLSYYAKGTSPTNGLEVAIAWYDGSTLSSPETTTVTLTSTWTKYTHTFDAPSITGLTLTNAAAYLELHWGQADTDTGTSAYEVNLAQAKLEIGDTATPFEHRSYGDELARCQRYYYKWYNDSVGNVRIAYYGAYNATRLFGPFTVPVPMRISGPTVTHGTGTYLQLETIDFVTQLALTNMTIYQATGNPNNLFGMELNVASGATAGEIYHLTSFNGGNSTNNFIAFDAEL